MILEDICDKAMHELKDYGGPEKWTGADLDAVDKLVHIVKGITTINSLRDYGYSSSRQPKRMSYDMDYYPEERSMMRSRDDGIMSPEMQTLKRMMETADTEEKRRAIQNCMNAMSVR